VAEDEETAARLHDSSTSLPDAIQAGLVFSVPSGTAVVALERRDDFVQVRILNGAMTGRLGWIRPEELTAK
jgi:hypothetical protein